MSKKFTKSNEILLRVLELYKEMPCLWNKSHKDYKNKYRRREANSILLKVYKEIDANATINTLIKKIPNLRTNFFKEVKKLMKKGPIYSPTLFYYNALTFPCDNTLYVLEDYQDTDTGEIEVSEWSADKYTAYEDSDNSHDSLSLPPPPAPKRRRETKSDLVKIHETVETREKDKISDQESEILGKSIGLQLRYLDKKQLTITQKLISDAIHYAKLGRLSENSVITLGNLPLETSFENSSTSHSHSLPNIKQSPQSVT